MSLFCCFYCLFSGKFTCCNINWGLRIYISDGKEIYFKWKETKLTPFIILFVWYLSSCGFINFMSENFLYNVTSATDVPRSDYPSIMSLFIVCHVSRHIIMLSVKYPYGTLHTSGKSDRIASVLFDIIHFSSVSDVITPANLSLTQTLFVYKSFSRKKKQRKKRKCILPRCLLIW